MAYREFWLIWLGQASHAFALWLEQTARPLLILALTDSAFQLGAVILVRTIPGFLLGLVEGYELAQIYPRLTQPPLVRIIPLTVYNAGNGFNWALQAGGQGFESPQHSD